MKRPSFFDRITNVVNPAQEEMQVEAESSPEPLNIEARNEERMRVEVPAKEVSRPSPRREQAEESSDVGRLLVDVFEADGNIVVQAMIAGVTPENLQISITRERVTIKGRRELPKEAKTETYHINELYWGSFERTIDLPLEVDPDAAEAVEKYGLLIIRLPKLDLNRTQELRVKSV